MIMAKPMHHRNSVMDSSLIVLEVPTPEDGVPCTGQGHIDGLLSELSETYVSIMKNETRIWMLRSLLDRGLSTNDIFFL